MSIRKKINGNFQVIATDGMTHITWSALKALRDGGKLIPGMFYRITDYVTTTAQENTQSAGHAFDVIVRADSANILNENATAALHSGDTYFAGQKLESWKLKYCLDNDSTRFAWADTTNGKGVIYQMIDERENDLPYDFKNIQFKRYKATKYLVDAPKYATGVKQLNIRISNDPALRWSCPTFYHLSENGTWYSDKNTSVNLTTSDIGYLKIEDNYSLLILSDGTEKWFYTFSNFTSDSDEVTDASLLDSVYKNKFGPKQYISNMLNLGNNIFIGTNIYSNTIGNSFNNNTIDNDFRNNIIGYGFNNNTIGNGFRNNIIGDGFNNNTISISFAANTISNNFNINTIGSSFVDNVIGNNFNTNAIGNDFNTNAIGNDFNGNAIGNDFSTNAISNNFSYNTINDSLKFSTIGNNFNGNTIGNNFSYNTIGNNFNNSTIGNNFNKNTISNYFFRNTIGDSFNYNTIGNGFGNNSIGNYYAFNHFEDGCQKLKFEVNGTGSASVQKYRVLAGTALSSATSVNVTAGNKAPYNVKMSADGNSIVVEAA